MKTIESISIMAETKMAINNAKMAKMVMKMALGSRISNGRMA